MARDERDAEVWDQAFDRDVVAERTEREILEQLREADELRSYKSADIGVDEDEDDFDDAYEEDDFEDDEFDDEDDSFEDEDDFEDDRYHDITERGERYARKRQNYAEDRRRRAQVDDKKSRKRKQKQSKKDKKKTKKNIRKNTQKNIKGGRTNEKRVREKESHPIRAFLVTLLILLLAFVGYLFIRLQQMQEKGLTNEEVSSYISDTVKESSQSGAMADYLNIAILGVDSVSGSLDAGNNRSDVMVIASINEKTGDIKLMSVYRDTYLDIGGGNYQKANAAYAFGGPEQTVQMLDRNLDLNISDYAVVGFEGIARIIDAVGGVEIDVQEDEIEHLNNYQLTMSEETGLKNVPITSAGTQTLNGLQATAYCRIRYTAGGDFQRAQRQRTVLTKTFEKIKSNPVSALASVNTLMGYVRTSLSTQEIMTLGAQAIRLSMGDSTGFPREDLRTVAMIGDQSCVVPITLSSNVTWLHEELFGDTGYVPSQTVQDISAYVSGVSGYY